MKFKTSLQLERQPSETFFMQRVVLFVQFKRIWHQASPQEGTRAGEDEKGATAEALLFALPVATRALGFLFLKTAYVRAQQIKAQKLLRRRESGISASRKCTIAIHQTASAENVGVAPAFLYK